MSKDPAFLFYTGDFISGTLLMTDEQVGKYMRCLCLQHLNPHKNNYRLKYEDLVSMCKGHDELVLSKFIKDEEGLYYNEKLLQVILERKVFTESRRINASKRKVHTTSEASAKHTLQRMEDENEDEDINSNKKRKQPVFTKPTIEEIQAYIKEKNLPVDAHAFYDFYESKNWMVGKNKMSKWKNALSGTWARGGKQNAMVQKFGPAAKNAEAYKNFLADEPGLITQSGIHVIETPVDAREVEFNVE